MDGEKFAASLLDFFGSDIKPITGGRHDQSSDRPASFFSLQPFPAPALLWPKKFAWPYFGLVDGVSVFYRVLL